jgi:predicted outer membrane repeat protein
MKIPYLTILAVLTALLLLAVPSQPAAAADAVVGSGNPVSCTETAFNTALASVQTSGGGTITFSCGVTPHTITFSAYKQIDSSVTIDGGGMVTLDGGNSASFFQIFFGHSLTLKNITLTRGGSPGIAPLENFGSLTLTGVEVRDHNTSLSPVLNSGTLVISGSSFTNNRVLSGAMNGGAVTSTAGTVNIYSSSFTGNQAADRGGAVYTEGGTLVAEHTRFNENTAKNGGAVYSGGVLATFDFMTFSGNTAVRGGAIEAASTLNLYDSTLNGNRATTSLGGAIYLNGNSTMSRLEISGNQAQVSGGGMYCASGSVILLSSSISHNIAGASGGGVYSTCAINGGNLTFSSNQAVSLGGGGFYQAGNTASSLAYTTFAGNQAGVFGAAVYNDGGGGSSLSLSRSLISANGPASCDGVLTSQGYNLADVNCAALTQSGDAQNASLPLSPLAFNGGSTRTHHILPGNAALNSIPAAQCQVAIDQRGIARPQDGACESGALEYTPMAVYLPLVRR